MPRILALPWGHNSAARISSSRRSRSRSQSAPIRI